MTAKFGDILIGSSAIAEYADSCLPISITAGEPDEWNRVWVIAAEIDGRIILATTQAEDETKAFEYANTFKEAFEASNVMVLGRVLDTAFHVASLIASTPLGSDIQPEDE
ncbi:MAG: hypothetical protein Fur0018_18380 [Anaerolineales bacterium]